MLLSILARVVVGFLLIVHGMAHYNLPTVWGSRPALHSWLLGNLNEAALRPISTTLWVGTLFIFLLAGVVTFTNQPFWRFLAAAGSLFSFVTMFLFWDNKMVLGVVVDAAVLIALLFLKWPTSNLIR